MKQRKRFLSVIIAFGFMIGCFSPIQSYALSNNVTTDNQTYIEVIQTQDTQNVADYVVMELNDTPQIAASGTGVTTTGSAINTTTPPAIEVKDEEDSWYRKQNPMKKEHQKLLWEYCKKRKLNYIDMLALIYTESNFNEKCSTGTYYGYFQISKGNCKDMADSLQTKNKPLDGAININWGTSIFSGILVDKRVKNLEGKKKRDVALSIFQRGSGGYDKYGISTKFLKVFYKKRAIVCRWFEVKK